MSIDRNHVSGHYRFLIHFRYIALAIALGFVLGALVGCKKSGEMIFEDLRVAEPPPSAHVAAGYFTITNDTNEDDKLLSVSTNASRIAEIHAIYYEDDVMRMEHKKVLEIESGESIVFEPGGFHLMLIDLIERPLAGGSVEIKMQFEKAGEKIIQAPVVPINQ